MPTLAQIRSRIGPELGFYHSGSCDATSTVAQIVERKAPILSQYTGADYFIGKWVLLGDSSRNDRCKLIKDADPGAGSLSVDSGFDAPPTGNYEIFNLIEPLIDLKRLINQALRRIPLLVEFSFNPTLGTAVRHRIPEAWVTSEAQIYQVGYLPAAWSRGENEPIWRQGEVEQDGESLFLRTGRNTAEQAIYVKARKPAFGHCKAASGNFGDQDGLILDTDECLGDLEWIASAAMVEVWEHLARSATESAAAKIIQIEQTKAAAWFSDQTAKNWRPPKVTYRKLIHWGPRR